MGPEERPKERLVINKGRAKGFRRSEAINVNRRKQNKIMKELNFKSNKACKKFLKRKRIRERNNHSKDLDSEIKE